MNNTLYVKSVIHSDELIDNIFFQLLLLSLADIISIKSSDTPRPALTCH